MYARARDTARSVLRGCLLEVVQLVKDLREEKFIIPDAARRICSTHNAALRIKRERGLTNCLYYANFRRAKSFAPAFNSFSSRYSRDIREVANEMCCDKIRAICAILYFF